MELTINGNVYQFSFNIGFLRNINKTIVLPAHAGVILEILQALTSQHSITRTCGGDPRLCNA